MREKFYSSVLILALRRVFRKKISRRVQYALWGLVLIRLLIPLRLPTLDFSVLTMAEPVQETISARLEAPAFTGRIIPITALSQQAPAPRPETPAAPSEAPASRPAAGPAADPVEEMDLTLTEVLKLVWLAGVGAMALWLLASNLSFAARLRRRRKPLDTGTRPI